MFSLTEAQQTKLNKWLKTQEQVLESQGKDGYNGAIGGALTYSFTPTSVGDIVKVYDSRTKAEYDLTDYDSW